MKLLDVGKGQFDIVFFYANGTKIAVMNAVTLCRNVLFSRFPIKRGCHGQSDVITDFDAVGGSGKQDFVTIDDDRPFDVVRSRGNVVINFEDGAKVTLLDVKWSQFSIEADIDLF